MYLKKLNTTVSLASLILHLGPKAMCGINIGGIMDDYSIDDTSCPKILNFKSPSADMETVIK